VDRGEVVNIRSRSGTIKVLQGSIRWRAYWWHIPRRGKGRWEGCLSKERVFVAIPVRGKQFLAEVWSVREWKYFKRRNLDDIPWFMTSQEEE
jgi:hypothetical protein